MRKPEQIQTVIIGAGQAGLSTGYFLARHGLPHVILDANPRVGDSWRRRWDSLRLFTPARFDGLAGMAYPAPSHSFPTKNEMADYLEAYASRLKLPVRTGVRVDRVSRQGDRYAISAGDQAFDAEHVVIAMATFQRPKLPPFVFAGSSARGGGVGRCVWAVGGVLSDCSSLCPDLGSRHPERLAGGRKAGVGAAQACTPISARGSSVGVA